MIKRDERGQKMSKQASMKSELFRRKERIRTSKKEDPVEPNKEKLLKISVGIDDL